MVYSPDNLSAEELITWTEEHFPEVRIRRRIFTNKNAEARHAKTGHLLASATSMFKLKKIMETDEFKNKLKCSVGFGFETAVFKGEGY